MKIELINRSCIVADGSLTGVVIEEQAKPFPYIVLEMRVKGAPDNGLPVEVTLGELALFTIVQAMRDSKVQKIRDILR
jgi:hypothetical protein